MPGGTPGSPGPLPKVIGRKSLASLTEQLMHEQPSLHGEAEFWGLAWEALAFIERTVQPGMATLETGAGASTIVFAARRRRARGGDALGRGGRADPG